MTQPSGKGSEACPRVPAGLPPSVSGCAKGHVRGGPPPRTKGLG